MKKRQLEIIIEEICNEEKIKYQMFSDGWGIKLNQNEKTTFILGYQFELNNAVSSGICNDKYMTSSLLLNNNIPVVKNHFFYRDLNENKIKYFSLLESLLNKYKKIVCKPNSGTGGRNVYLVDNKEKLKNAVNNILISDYGLIISEYLNIENEYRAIVLNNEVKLIFSKQIDYIVGDEIHTIQELLHNSKVCLQTIKELLINNNIKEINLNSILKKDEKFLLSWKHNLGNGAKPIIIEDQDLIKKITDLALKTTNTIGINFASVDIVKVNNELKVLEINSGVMMEYFSSVNNHNYQITKNIYKEAIFTILRK